MKYDKRLSVIEKRLKIKKSKIVLTPYHVNKIERELIIKQTKADIIVWDFANKMDKS